MNLRKIVLSAFIFSFAFNIFAQVSVDPEDSFYEDVTGWYLKGYIDYVPQLKPYPLNVIKNILQKVITCEEINESSKAQYYSRRYFGKNWKLSLYAKGDIKSKLVEKGGDDTVSKYQYNGIFTGGFLAAGDVQLAEKCGFGFDTNLLVNNNDVDSSSVMPRYINNSDKNKVKAFYITTNKADFIADLNGSVTYGTENSYGSLGFNKIGFGLYPNDSTVFNPTSYQSLNGSYNYSGKRFHFTQSLLALGAQNLTDSSKYALGKFLSFHSLKYTFFENRLSFSFYESIVYDYAHSPIYLIPFSYVAMGNLFKTGDNIFLGLGTEVRPLPCIALTFDTYFDDIIPSNLFTLKLNESASRIAMKGGVVYSPKDSICSLITCDYSLVTPYTYTFYTSRDTEYDFHDYTNFGINLGSNLPPNSDRVAMKIIFKPYPGFKVSTNTALIRHGNAYESLSDEEVLALYGNKDDIPLSDGSVDMSTKNQPSAKNFTNFLKQDSIMYVVQGGISASYEFLLTSSTYFWIGFDYTFEYINKDGVDTNIFNQAYSTVEEVQNARTAWHEALHDSYNHYFTISAKITF